jgi:Fic family protein
VGGATTDAWITLPRRAAAATVDGAGPSLRETFAALARDARAAERGLQVALELCDADDARVRTVLGRAAYSALDLLGLLRERIVVTIPDAARTLGLTPPTAGAAVARLVELGIAREVTGKARSRAFAYDGIVGALAPPSAT